MKGPRNRYRPRKPRSPLEAPTFNSEYAALVHARIHNPRLALKGKATFDRCVVFGPMGTRDIDLFRNYESRSHSMPAPYCVISQRQWPETRFEYAFKSLEEAEAVVDVDERLKKGRVRDYVIVTPDDKKLLAKFQEPELRHLYESMTRAVLPDGITYNELLNKVADKLKVVETGPCPAKLLEEYQRKQRALQPQVKTPVATVEKSAKSTVKEIKMNTATAETESKKPARKTAAAKAPAKAAKKAAGKAPKKAAAGKVKGGGSKGKGKAAAAKGTTNKAAGDGLGREGTLSRFINEQLMAGKDNATIAAAAAKKFPESSSTEAKHVAWSRWKLGQNGMKVPTPKE